MKILIKHKHTYRKPLQAAASSLLLSLACLVAPLASANNQLQLLDQVVAIVDDDVVTASELKERIQQVKLNIEKSGKTAPPMQEIQQEILDQLIIENIQLQMALRAGVRISDAQLNDSMLRIAQQNRMSLIQFKEALERDGLSYTGTREQIREHANTNTRTQRSGRSKFQHYGCSRLQAQSSPSMCFP